MASQSHRIVGQLFCYASKRSVRRWGCRSVSATAIVRLWANKIQMNTNRARFNWPSTRTSTRDGRLEWIRSQGQMHPPIILLSMPLLTIRCKRCVPVQLRLTRVVPLTFSLRSERIIAWIEPRRCTLSFDGPSLPMGRSHHSGAT